jgi:hypothetical protein
MAVNYLSPGSKNLDLLAIDPSQLDKTSSKGLSGIQNALKIRASADSEKFKLALRALKYFTKGKSSISYSLSKKNTPLIFPQISH